MQRLLIDILSSVWLIDKERSGAYASMLHALMSGDPLSGIDHSAAREQARSFVLSASGEERSSLGDPSTPQGSIAVVPIRSEIMKYDQFCGPRGTQSLTADIRSADADPNISGIVLVIDSPGGQASGTDLLADAIRSASKPVVAYVEGLAASAAYWIASAADRIIASSEMDRVGSIGTMLFFADLKPYWEKQGVKFHEFYATASVDKNREFNQILDGNYEPYTRSTLDRINGQFLSAVRQNRPVVDDSALTGKLYFSADAISMGLIDQIGTFEDALRTTIILSQSNQSVSLNSQSMKMNPGWKAILSLLGIGSDSAASEELTSERIEKLNAELESLRASIESLNAQLATEQKSVASLRDELAAEKKAHETTSARLQEVLAEDAAGETPAMKDKDKITGEEPGVVFAHDTAADEFLG